MDMLLEDGSVRINDLLDTFSVSIETVRRDLSELEKAGILTKTYGGAVLASNPRGMTEVADWRERQSIAPKEKDLIGQHAAGFIPDGCVVALEVGTTMFALARHLEGHKNLTILTNDLLVAQTLWPQHGNRAFLVGGYMGAGYYTCGDLSRDFIEKFAVIDLFVFSTEGLTLAEGLTTPNGEVNALKKIYIQKASKLIALCDHTKFGRKGIFHTCALERLDLLITDSKAPPHMLDKIREKGVKVEVVPVD